MVSRSAISWTMIGCLSVICYLSIFGSNFIHVYAQEAEQSYYKKSGGMGSLLSRYGSGFCSRRAGSGYISLHLLAIQGIQS